MIQWYFFSFVLQSVSPMICCLLCFGEPFPFSVLLFSLFGSVFLRPYIVTPYRLHMLNVCFCSVMLRLLLLCSLYNIAIYVHRVCLFCSLLQFPPVVNLWMCVHASVCVLLCSVLNLYSIKHDYHHCSFLFILFYTSVTEFGL